MTAKPGNAERLAAITADGIVAEIRPMLARYGMYVQGAVCAELMAIWIAGHDAEFREAMLELQINLIRDLVQHYTDGKNGR
jgi:hypothetical protein